MSFFKDVCKSCLVLLFQGEDNQRGWKKGEDHDEDKERGWKTGGDDQDEERGWKTDGDDWGNWLQIGSLIVKGKMPDDVEFQHCTLLPSTVLMCLHNRGGIWQGKAAVLYPN